MNTETGETVIIRSLNKSILFNKKKINIIFLVNFFLLIKSDLI
jgi:hypothetical protein